MKMKKLAAAVGVAMSLGIVSQQANAVIETECCGSRGDALMFPVFIGMSGFENYYAITNDANAWIQGHLRFRGAAWCGELMDFDVILSPGDVFVFRVADVDGDGRWEVDQTLDELNFQYTGLLEVPDQGDIGLATSHCTSAVDGSKQWKCMQPSFELIPDEPDIILTEGRIAYQQTVGYVQFFGEAILTDMTHEIMAVLMSGVPGNWAPYQTDVFSKRGTNSWKWSNAAGQFARFAPNPSDSPWVGDRGLSDVPNMLAGVGFVSAVDRAGVGVGYNAVAFSNFRTDVTEHRIDNYRIDADGNPLDSEPAIVRANRAVIVHHENGASNPVGTSPYGDYVYGFREQEKGGSLFEAGVSFNNTWGPTLADGDTYPLDNGLCDDMDAKSIGPNSIAEVEEAIRKGGQTFGGYYFDEAAPAANHTGSTTLKSWFFAWYPTKFFYAEDAAAYGLTTLKDYILNAARFLEGGLIPPKTYIPQVWDIYENSNTPPPETQPGQCISPAIGPDCFTTPGTPGGNDPEIPLSECLTVFNIDQVKNAFSTTVASFTTGRFLLVPKAGFNDPAAECGANYLARKTWPGFMYSFEWGADGSLAHWRCLIR